MNMILELISRLRQTPLLSRKPIGICRILGVIDDDDDKDDQDGDCILYLLPDTNSSRSVIVHVAVEAADLISHC